MVRIFIVLACFAWLSLVANFAAGLWIGDINAAAQTYRTAYEKQRATDFDKAATSEQKRIAAEELTEAGKLYSTPRQRLTLHWRNCAPRWDCEPARPRASPAASIWP